MVNLLGAPSLKKTDSASHSYLSPGAPPLGVGLYAHLPSACWDLIGSFIFDLKNFMLHAEEMVQ